MKKKKYLGKIYVENERARLTHRLSQIKEADGEIKEAAKIMHELQVSNILLYKSHTVGIMRLTQKHNNEEKKVHL